MATLRIGHLAVDGAHVVVGLEWFTAPTAHVCRCHLNQDIASRKQRMASRRAFAPS